MDYNSHDFMTSEVSYTKDELEQRDKFVTEYIKDYNSYGAAIRIGFMDDLALEVAKTFLNEPYVQRALSQAENQRSSMLQTVQDDKENLNVLPHGFVPHDEVMDKQRILSGLFREAFYKGPGAAHSSRVSALTTLAKIYKLDKEENVEESVTTNVMVVPPVGSLNDWEAAAVEQQASLKQTVKE